MSRPKVKLTGYSRAERHSVISAISDVISTAGGWVDEVNFFSNISVALKFAISSSAGPKLAHLLSDVPLRLNDMDLENLVNLASVNEAEVMCSVIITFAHDDPDLRQHIPSVPG